jgi:hypothetical protein
MIGSHCVDVIDDFATLKNLQGEWNQAFPVQTSEPWQCFSWVESCATSFGRDRPLRCVVVRERGRLAAAAALVLAESNQPLRPLRLEFLGGDNLKEPNQFVGTRPDAIERLVEHIAAEPTYPVRLSRVPTDPSGASALFEEFRRRRWITRTISMPYPYIDLAPGAHPIKKSLRADLARARRRVSRFGSMWTEVVSLRSSDEVAQRLDDAFRIEASGWKGRNQTSILSNPARHEFFQRYADAARREGTLRLTFLKIDGDDAAVQYAVETANQYWLLNIGYDDRFRECSPGNLLLEETISAAAARGLTRYNLLGKVEPWTNRWSSHTQDSLVLAAYRLNYHGVRAMMSDALYLLQKRRRDQIARQNRHEPALAPRQVTVGVE